MEYRNIILSKKEREDILEFLLEEKKINVNFKLTKDEIVRIKKLEKPYLRIGYALQLLYLKTKGVSINTMGCKIPENVIKFVAAQLECSANSLEEYWKIKNTKSRHFQEICRLLDY